MFKLCSSCFKRCYPKDKNKSKQKENGDDDNYDDHNNSSKNKKGNDISSPSDPSSPPSKQVILCYGDSLTAGNYGLQTKYPYASYLEAKLNENNKKNQIVVEHCGHFGWTSLDLLHIANEEGGLRTLIREHEDPPISLVIILAGTNDLGEQRPVKEILDSLISLHLICHDEKVPQTLAIGIPPSLHQSSNTRVARYAMEVNQLLEIYCASEPKATYIPFMFDYAENDPRWSYDGLHLTELGYKELGERLVPTVQKLLKLKK